MRIKLVKLGAEVEGYIRTLKQVKLSQKERGESLQSYNSKLERKDNPDFPSQINSLLASSGKQLWKPPHYDTGRCTEIDLLPFINLQDFADNLRETIGTIYNYCDEHDWLYMLLGNIPISGHAGGHLHVSLPNYNLYFGSNDNMLHIIGEKLYYYQAFISLLGQNSGYEIIPTHRNRGTHYDGREIIWAYRKGNLSSIKDTRLKHYGHHYTNVNISGRTGYTINDLGTIEIRFPSSSSFYQTVGIATFIKACLFSNNSKHLKEEQGLREVVRNIPWLGSLTPIEFEEDEVPYSLGTTFKLLLESSSFGEGLDLALSELNPNLKKDIRDFYYIFTQDLSMTDFYNEILKDKKGIVKSCEGLHEIGFKEYIKKKPIWKQVENVDKGRIRKDYNISKQELIKVRYDYQFLNNGKINHYKLKIKDLTE